MSLLGERVAVSLPGGGNREGILLNGRRKQTNTIQQFVVRFEDGDIRVYRGDQLQLTGIRASMDEFIKEGDVLFTKRTLGVCRYIGEIQDTNPAICLQAIDPRLPNPDNINFMDLVPDGNLTANGSYAILTNLNAIKKIVPPEHILGMLSRIKDKYIELVDSMKNNPPAVTAAAPARPAETAAPPLPAAEEAPATMVYKKFEPDRLGLSADWTTGVVEQIVEKGQAKDLDVQVGWVITSVNGEPYNEALLDAALDGKDPIEIAFLTSIAQAPEPVVDAAAQPEPVDVVTAAKFGVQGQKLEDETQDYSRPGGVAASTLYEIQMLREKNAELEEKLKQTETQLKLVQNKNAELMKESQELNRVRIKIDMLRNGKKAFGDKIKHLESENESMLKTLNDVRTAHAHTAEQLKIMSEENHRLIKKYKKVKRRQSRTMPRSSNMKILRGPTQHSNDDGAGDGDDGDGGSVLHEYLARTAPSDDARSADSGTGHDLASLKEKDFNKSGSPVPDVNEDINANSEPPKPVEEKKTKKKGFSLFSSKRR